MAITRYVNEEESFLGKSLTRFILEDGYNIESKVSAITRGILRNRRLCDTAWTMLSTMRTPPIKDLAIKKKVFYKQHSIRRTSKP